MAFTFKNNRLLLRTVSIVVVFLFLISFTHKGLLLDISFVFMIKEWTTSCFVFIWWEFLNANFVFSVRKLNFVRVYFIHRTRITISSCVQNCSRSILGFYYVWFFAEHRFQSVFVFVFFRISSRPRHRVWPSNRTVLDKVSWEREKKKTAKNINLILLNHTRREHPTN